MTVKRSSKRKASAQKQREAESMQFGYKDAQAGAAANGVNSTTGLTEGREYMNATPASTMGGGGYGMEQEMPRMGSPNANNNNMGMAAGGAGVAGAMAGAAMMSGAPSDAAPSDPMQIAETMEVVFNYVPNLSDEIYLYVGDPVIVKLKFDDGWAFGFNMTTKTEGSFPLACVAPYAPEGSSGRGSEWEDGSGSKINRNSFSIRQRQS
ncbi:hypothetical protein HDV05_003197, partial [Chytridiales sp. JEL 0842]